MPKCVHDKLNRAGERIALGTLLTAAGGSALTSNKVCGLIMGALVGAAGTSAAILIDAATCAETCKAEAKKSREGKQLAKAF